MREPFDPSKVGLPVVPQEWNALTSRIIEAAMEVHTILGPGLLEGVYEDAVCCEFGLRGIRFERQMTFPIIYKGQVLREQRCDLLVERLVVLELKSTEGVDEKHLSTMLGYMRALDAPLGLLLNFNTGHLRDGLHRRINSRSSKFESPAVVIRPTESPSPLPPPRTLYVIHQADRPIDPSPEQGVDGAVCGRPRDPSHLGSVPTVAELDPVRPFRWTRPNSR